MIKIVSGNRYIHEISTGKLIHKHKENIKHAIYSYGHDVTGEIKRILTTGKRSGRLYRYKGRTYRASAPGEPPAKRSGNLANLIDYKARPFELVVRSDAEYSGWLDKGTKKMKPRPFFVKTNKENAYKLERDLRSIK